MEVEMLKATTWNGERLEVGDRLEVEDRTGRRWLSKGIAQGMGPEPPADDSVADGDPDTGTPPADDGPFDFEAMTMDELRPLAEMNGVDHKGLRKAELIEAIREALTEAPPDDPNDDPDDE